MRVINVHERLLDTPAERVGRLIDSLASDEDLLWPIDRWPPMRFDRPLGIGASGGHGPIRYVVESYTPGRKIQFRFLEPKGFLGVHRFDLEPAADRTILRHTIEMEVSGKTWFAWSLVIRPLHDALLEDALDRAERYTGKQIPVRKLPICVRFLRWMMRRRKVKG